MKSNGGSTRRTVRLISFAIALIVVLTVTSVSGYVLANRNRQLLEYSYQRALGELSSYIGNLDITLKKSHYAASAHQLEGLSSQMWRDAELAKASLEQLPANSRELETTNKFLSQVGNFCMSVTDDLPSTGSVSLKDRESMEQLSQYASSSVSALAELESRLEAGDFSFEAEEKALSGGVDSGTATVSANSGFREMAQDFDDFPTLIYDGPYSEHLLRQKPKLLKGARQYSETQCRQALEGLGGLPSKDWKADGHVAGRLSLYRFSSETATAQLSEYGGRLVTYEDTRTVDAHKLTAAEAVRKGNALMKSLGFSSFSETYYTVINGTVVINYAYVQENVRMYPDLVKLGVALDDGSIMSVDATGFIMNHHDRTVETATVSAAQAKAKLSTSLKNASDGRLALVPTDGGGEQLCYEFDCKGDDGENVVVFINAQTGWEEEIFILLEDETGVLVM